MGLIIVAAIIKILVIVGFVFNMGALLTWVDRRQSAMMQDRIGPNRAVLKIGKFELDSFISEKRTLTLSGSGGGSSCGLRARDRISPDAMIGGGGVGGGGMISGDDCWIGRTGTSWPGTLPGRPRAVSTSETSPWR